MSVWSTSPEWKYEPIATANGKELFAESPALLKSEVKKPEIRLSYSNAKRIRDSEHIPPQQEGCVVLNNTDDSLRLLAGLESFLSSQSGNINSIKAVITHEHPLHKRSLHYRIRLGLAFRDASFERNTIQKTDSSWTPLLRGRPAQSDVKHYSQQNANFDKVYTPLDSFIIDSNDNSVSYFLVGGPSGGGPSGITALTFLDDCASLNYITLLHNDNFTIQFVDATEIKQYKHPLTVRILLTPFSVALDVVTFPVQLILVATAEYWAPR